ncbi:MAG TPA: cytochrome c-type biogenesis protein CcmH [Terriglobales bacterium]|jgi:cytochrome c-type biogenesis protein CcmH/NrfF|nr:cytochrome c-type biogenesis protein CcmH [Terriglobales bacterium]
MKLRTSSTLQRVAQCGLVVFALFTFLGVGADDARFNTLGHRLMCVCGCNQILLECNHVGCEYSDRMRGELMAALDRGENDDLALQGFVQEFGATVVAAPSTKGFGRVAWIVPFLALALGLMLLVMVVRVWRMRPDPALADGIRPPRGVDLERFRRQAQEETQL